MKKSSLLIVLYTSFSICLWGVLQANTAQAVNVNFTSIVDPSPDTLLPSPSYIYQHDLKNVGFNPATDTLTSAEFQVYFTEENWLNGTDDSVTVKLDGNLVGVSIEPTTGIGNTSWDDVFSVDVGLLQTDGILTVTLESGGGTIFKMSELTAQGTGVVFVPPAIWLLLGL